MKYDVCVVGGCGHVGLPLALCFAKEGKQVAVFDINKEALALVASGKMPFKEEGADELLKNALNTDRLYLTDSAEVVSESEVVVLILGTPLDAHLHPTLSAITRSVKQCLPHFRDGQLVVLRSTVYPGTSEKVHAILNDSGLKLDVAFCPERVLEGHAIRETYELPQIVSAFTEQGLQRARDLFSAFTDDIIELLPLEAELVKIYSNTWRYVSFAMANQFYTIANDHGLDYYRIREAMMHNYPRARDLPKAGFAAGPCLFKDTMQLATFCNNNFFLGHAAMLINEGIPAYLVAFLKNRYPIHEMTIGILGMAFKANSDDIRESLAYKLRKVLEHECRNVLITDPYVKDDRIIPVDEVVKQSDILILGAPHDDYKNLDLKDKYTVDIWKFLGESKQSDRRTSDR